MPEMIFQGVALRCACGSTDVVAIRPGHDRIAAVIEDARAMATARGERRVTCIAIPTEPDEPTTAQCRRCCGWWREPQAKVPPRARVTAQLDFIEALARTA